MTQGTGTQDKIAIENLDLYYGDFHALKDINMDLPAKEITAFMAPADAENPHC